MTASVTVEGRTLAAALKPICAVVEKRHTIPILSNVRLDYSKNSEALHLTGTDLDIEISTFIDVIDHEKLIDTTLPAKLLYDIAKAAGPAPVKLTWLADNRKIEINVADGDAIYMIDPIASADFPEMAKPEWSTAVFESFTNGRLSTLLGKVKDAISTEETRYYLNGVYWHCKEGQHAMVATDGHRLCLCKYEKSDGVGFGAIIPRKTVGIIASLTAGKDATMQTCTGGLKLRVMTGRFTVVSKLVDGTFPDYGRVIPTGNDKVWEFVVAPFMSALDRVTLVSAERGRAVRLDLAETITLTVNNADMGKAVATVPGSGPASPMSIGFNAVYLSTFIRPMRGKARLRLSDPGSPTFVEDDDEEMTRIIMPMRV